MVEIAIEKFIVAFRQKKNLGIVRPRDSKMLLKHETILYDDGLGWFWADFFFTLIDDVISEVNTREAKQRKKNYAICDN